VTDGGALRVIGGGLAGCEAAWQAAERGLDVELCEMRPRKRGPAHVTDALAELVCSNSLRGASLENAVGLLKEELARMDSLIVTSARAAAVPAGGALAVDRERFAALVESRLAAHPRITIRRDEATSIDAERPTIVACGPLPSEPLAAAIDALLLEACERLAARGLAPVSQRRLHYYDAAAPIVATESLDLTQMYAKSRYEKGDAEDYLNIPLDRAQYATFVHDLRTLPKHAPKEFEADLASGGKLYFEGCLPVEEMAARGEETLRFGPLKPVGLRHPVTGVTPHAVVQLRKENARGTAYNLVGFQTRLTWPAQKEAFGKLPGLAQAEWLRLGVMHRNSFLDAPRLLGPDLRLHGCERTWFAGQITGAEGYVEAAACGLLAAIAASRRLQGLEFAAVPPDTMLGSIVAHLQNTATDDFQPANVTWRFVAPLDAERRVRPDGRPIKMDKRLKRQQYAERALTQLEAWRSAVAVPREDAALV